jgi:hypothetical protein
MAQKTRERRVTAMIGNPHKEESTRTGGLSAKSKSPVQFGREICGSVSDASEREWLVTNGSGIYAGGPRERDSAYHQGTVWGWFLGPFVQAHVRVFDVAVAASFLEPIASHIRTCGRGTASEIFDGDAPFIPRGAWPRLASANCFARGPQLRVQQFSQAQML